MYERPEETAPLSQGDIFDDCPIVFWEVSVTQDGIVRKACELHVRVVVLTQSCDLENVKTTRVQVALVHGSNELVDAGLLAAKTIRDNVRLHRVYGWYFLEASNLLPESIVDLRDVHTLPRALLEHLARAGKRVCTIRTPYREHLAQHFGVAFSRIALPNPPKTVD